MIGPALQGESDPTGRAADTASACGFFVPEPADKEAGVTRISESKAISNPKGGMPMRRELLNQGLMYGLVSLFVFIVAPLVT